MAQHFQIQHLALAIDDPRGLVAPLADKMLGMFRRPLGVHELAPGRLRLEVHTDANRAVHREAVPRIWQGTLDGMQFAVYRRGARRRIEVPHRAILDFDLERGWAHLAVLQAEDATAKWFLLLRLVCDGLTRSGHSFLHAACLAMPHGDQWRGVVLSAPSNTGKTTTALALANSGWRLLGDDITYVRPPHMGSRVWGFPRSCHVRPGAYERLPWLRGVETSPPDDLGVRKLPLANLGPLGWVDAPWLEPALVIILAPPNTSATRVEAIDRATALNQLSGESINAVPGVCDDDAARDFVTLGRLVCSAPGCRLSVGPDPSDVALRLARFLGSFAHITQLTGGRTRSQAA